MLSASKFVISFLRGQLINHDTPLPLRLPGRIQFAPELLTILTLAFPKTRPNAQAWLAPTHCQVTVASPNGCTCVLFKRSVAGLRRGPNNRKACVFKNGPQMNEREAEVDTEAEINAEDMRWQRTMRLRRNRAWKWKMG